jgi:tetratricopeptide (TPR) repeat protein
MNSSNQTLARAHALDQQGRLAEAVEAYRQFLTAEPRNGDGLQLLGIALARMGRTAEAVEALSAAAVVKPNNPFLQANLANALKAIGRHADALTCYGSAVALKPDFAAAHRGRGMTLLHLGQMQEAVQALSNAIRLEPGNATLYNDLGVALERADQKIEALAQFERATQLDSRLVEAHHNRGLLEATLGRYPQALESLDRALALQPNMAALHANRGNVLADLGRSEQALESFEKALALQPRDELTLRKRGQLLLRLQRPSAALETFDKVLAFAPQDSAAHFLHGVSLALLQNHEQALRSFDRSLALAPASPEVLNNRGVALGQLARHEEALESFASAIAVAPGYIEAHTNAANTLTTLQRHAEAVQSFDRALAIKPDDSNLRWGKARALLSLGDFRNGWPLYESRLQLEHLRPWQRHTQLQRWQGWESIEGRTLLVYAEQGLGDTVQFFRYVCLLEARGAKVILEAQPALQSLLQTARTQARILPFDAPLPSFDLATPLLSLPGLLGTELDSIPGGVPYVSAEPARTAWWKERLAALPGIKVGLTWQGHIETEKHGGYIGRSFGLAAAAPLAAIPAVTLISLQKGEASQQRSQVDFGAKVLELTDPREMSSAELLDTAALLCALDLVITTDTLMAHLAGALGIPVWVVLSASPDWRWLTQRDDSPWYPTMRLFRQGTRGGWSEVFERVASELAALRTASG